MAPIELVGVTRGKTQRHIGVGQRGSAFLAPAPGVAADGVITASIAKLSQLFIKADTPSLRRANSGKPRIAKGSPLRADLGFQFNAD